MADKKLTDLQHVRKRPSMYIGDTTIRGLGMLSGEIISNSIDQFLHDHATLVNIQFDQEQVIVTDDGAGLPFTSPSNSGNDYRITDFITQIHRTPSADDHAPHVHIHSPIGVGLFVVAALCEKITFQSVRDGQFWQQSYSRGKKVAGIDPEPLHADHPIQKGTRIAIVPDSEIFPENCTDRAHQRKLMLHAAHLFPGLRVEFGEEVFFALGGLADLAVSRCDAKFNVPKVPFSLETEIENVKLSVAAIGNSDETKITSWCNGTQTWEGGTHQDALASALQKSGWMPEAAYIHVVMLEPKLAGPTKTRLEVPEKFGAIESAIHTALKDFVSEKF